MRIGPGRKRSQVCRWNKGGQLAQHSNALAIFASSTIKSFASLRLYAPSATLACVVLKGRHPMGKEQCHVPKNILHQKIREWGVMGAFQRGGSKRVYNNGVIMVGPTQLANSFESLLSRSGRFVSTHLYLHYDGTHYWNNFYLCHYDLFYILYYSKNSSTFLQFSFPVVSCHWLDTSITMAWMSPGKPEPSHFLQFWQIWQPFLIHNSHSLSFCVKYWKLNDQIWFSGLGWEAVWAAPQPFPSGK